MTVPDEVADVTTARAAAPDFDAIFHANYAGIARIALRVVGDPTRAEDIAVEAFWRLWRHPEAMGESSGGWLRRTAIRLALDDLRRRSRRLRYETLFAVVGVQPRRPDEVFAGEQEQSRVRAVLAAIPARQAELLLLQSDGMAYADIAALLSINPASVGTQLARARATFRQEYVRRHGDQR